MKDFFIALAILWTRLRAHRLERKRQRFSEKRIALKQKAVKLRDKHEAKLRKLRQREAIGQTIQVQSVQAQNKIKWQ